MSKVLLVFVAFAIVAAVTPSYARQRSVGDVVLPRPAAALENLKLAQRRGYSATGTHQCGSEKGRSCVVSGSAFFSCNEASIDLRTRDCCPTSSAGGKSTGFTLNFCIEDRGL
jgi:hypothetical protein